jgi:hypothetical protein
VQCPDTLVYVRYRCNENRKLVQMNFNAHPMHENPLWWVNRYAEISDYEKLIKCLDVNFHKHKKSWD